MFAHCSSRHALAGLTFSFALSASYAAYGITIRDDLTFADYEAQVNTAPYDATGQFSNNQSGSLIAPNWVLGAAHIAAPATFTASDGTIVNVLQRIVFPGDASSSNAIDGNDFALFRLSTPINSVSIAPLHDPVGSGVSYSDLLNQLSGLAAVYTGSGETGNGITGAATSGSRDILAGTNIIDDVGLDFSNGAGVIENMIASDFDDPDTTGPDNDPGTALEVGIADKDSGGGVWVNIGNGPVLIAVHSTISQGPNSNVGGEYGQLNISTVLTDEAYNWVQATIPEPSSLALLAVGSLLATRRRRQ